MDHLIGYIIIVVLYIQPQLLSHKQLSFSRGHPDWKKRPGVNFFLRLPLGGLTNYVIRHTSIYSNNIKLRLKSHCQGLFFHHHSSLAQNMKWREIICILVEFLIYIFVLYKLDFKWKIFYSINTGEGQLYYTEFWVDIIRYDSTMSM